MNIDNIPVLDLKFLRRISFKRTFSYSRTNGSGTIIGPVDFTGKEVVAEFTGAIQNGTLVLSSNDAGPTAKGSQLILTDEANALFEFNLTADELATPVAQDGDWLLYYRDGANAIPLARGHIQFVPVVTGGSI